MHGERYQDYTARRWIEQLRREATAEYLRSPKREVEILPACCCGFLPHPHLLAAGSYAKQVHDGPPDRRYEQMREDLWKYYKVPLKKAA
jgi:hypothetical protein